MQLTFSDSKKCEFYLKNMEMATKSPLYRKSKIFILKS